jgi:hypothetical protein
MRYELLVQTGDPNAPYDPSKVDAALELRGAQVSPDGTRLWRLEAGELEVRTLIEGGVPRATVIRVPLQENLALVGSAVREGAALAREVGAQLFDPQLTRPLSEVDEGLVTDQYLRTARYAGEMLGVSGAVGLSFSAPAEGLPPGMKVLLWVGGALLMGYLLLG